MLKAILASLTGYASDRTVMETALALAHRHGAHVDALLVRIDVAAATATAEIAGARICGTDQRLYRAITKEDQARAHDAQRVYTEVCERNLPHGKHAGPQKATASFQQVITAADETLHQARLHDLAIVARVPELASDRLDHLVMAAGKPIVIAPAKPPKTVGDTVAIAWKDSPEAARAVTAALPILMQARRVVVIAISETGTGRDAGHASADGLLALLQRHGIAAQLRAISAPTAFVAEKIKEIAYDAEADLIVMGAYGHSRMREVILGGTTHTMLADCDIAVLMVH